MLGADDGLAGKYIMQQAARAIEKPNA